MSIRRIVVAYFSPTGNARKIASVFAEEMAEKLKVNLEHFDFTLPSQRDEGINLNSQDYLVISIPVYAGRIPNKILPWIQNNIKGEGTRTTALVTFGNRNPDSAIGELKCELENNGFQVVSAAAVVSEHVFSEQLAGGRPNDSDLNELIEFAVNTSRVVNRVDKLDLGQRGQVNPYYVPKRVDGQPAKFLKAKPKVRRHLCIGCGVCAESCPMGSIDKEDTSLVNGVCIKCQACIKMCSVGARFFDDEDFLSHRDMLIENFTSPAKNEFYL